MKEETSENHPARTVGQLFNRNIAFLLRLNFLSFWQDMDTLVELKTDVH